MFSLILPGKQHIGSLTSSSTKFLHNVFGIINLYLRMIQQHEYSISEQFGSRTVWKVHVSVGADRATTNERGLSVGCGMKHINWYISSSIKYFREPFSEFVVWGDLASEMLNLGSIWVGNIFRKNSYFGCNPSKHIKYHISSSDKYFSNRFSKGTSTLLGLQLCQISAESVQNLI